MGDEPIYTLGFAAAVSTICALAVSGAAVSLRPRIAENRALDRQWRVLVVAGLAEPGEAFDRARVRERFAERVSTQIVDLQTGIMSAPGDDDDALVSRSRPAPANDAGLLRIPTHTFVYIARADGRPSVIVLPVEGKGLWSTLRGFLALDANELRVVRGVEFYEHAETPGLGGEIDNPRWKALWNGRIAFDERGEPALHVARGSVGSPEQYPHGVDAISGATITTRGVTELMRFWLGPEGYGPMIERARRHGGVR